MTGTAEDTWSCLAPSFLCACFSAVQGIRAESGKQLRSLRALLPWEKGLARGVPAWGQYEKRDYPRSLSFTGPSSPGVGQVQFPGSPFPSADHPQPQFPPNASSHGGRSTRLVSAGAGWWRSHLASATGAPLQEASSPAPPSRPPSAWQPAPPSRPAHTVTMGTRFSGQEQMCLLCPLLSHQRGQGGPLPLVS